MKTNSKAVIFLSLQEGGGETKGGRGRGGGTDTHMILILALDFLLEFPPPGLTLVQALTIGLLLVVGVLLIYHQLPELSFMPSESIDLPSALSLSTIALDTRSCLLTKRWANNPVA